MSHRCSNFLCQFRKFAIFLNHIMYSVALFGELLKSRDGNILRISEEDAGSDSYPSKL